MSRAFRLAKDFAFSKIEETQRAARGDLVLRPSTFREFASVWASEESGDHARAIRSDAATVAVTEQVNRQHRPGYADPVRGRFCNRRYATRFEKLVTAKHAAAIP